MVPYFAKKRLHTSRESPAAPSAGWLDFTSSIASQVRRNLAAVEANQRVRENSRSRGRNVRHEMAQAPFVDSRYSRIRKNAESKLRQALFRPACPSRLPALRWQ